VLFYLGQPPVKDQKPVTGKAQRAVLDVLCEMSGNEPGIRIGYERFRERCAEADIPKSSFWDAFNALKKDRKLVHEGPEVWLPGGPSGPSDPNPKGYSDRTDARDTDSAGPKRPIRTISDVSDGFIPANDRKAF
jgi:hypothetical protein